MSNPTSASVSPAVDPSRPDAMAVLAVLTGVVVVTLDISLTSTAIPAIARDLGVAPGTTLWIVNIYYLAVVAGLLPLGALGETHGHRRVFLGGLLIFAIGALACGLAAALPALMAGRAILGLGAAAVAATTPALIRSLYPPEQLNRGLGMYAMVVGLALAFGPTAASAVLGVSRWPWLYLTMAPVALAALAIAFRKLPMTERSARAFDSPSALLCAGMFACILFAIAGAAHLGWKPVVAAAAAGALCGYALIKRESGRTAPILAFDLFRIPFFSLSAATSACAFAVQGLVFVVLPLLLHFRFGYSERELGLLILPWPLTLAGMTFIAAPLARRVPAALLGCAGLLVVAVGLTQLAALTVAPTRLELSAYLVLCGIGFGLFQSPNMIALMSSAPTHRSGGAGGVLAASRLLGQAIGAAAVALSVAKWPASGVEIALWTGVAMALLGSLTSALRMAPLAGRPP